MAQCHADTGRILQWRARRRLSLGTWRRGPCARGEEEARRPSRCSTSWGEAIAMRRRGPWRARECPQRVLGVSCVKHRAQQRATQAATAARGTSRIRGRAPGTATKQLQRARRNKGVRKFALRWREWAARTITQWFRNHVRCASAACTITQFQRVLAARMITALPLTAKCMERAARILRLPLPETSGRVGMPAFALGEPRLP